MILNTHLKLLKENNDFGPKWNLLISSLYFIFFLFIYVGCPGQLMRTTTIPHGPLDILQAQEQVRHRGGDRRAHRGSNLERGRNKSHDWPQQLDPQVPFPFFIVIGFDFLIKIGTNYSRVLFSFYTLNYYVITNIPIVTYNILKIKRA